MKLIKKTKTANMTTPHVNLGKYSIFILGVDILTKIKKTEATTNFTITNTYEK